MALVGGFLTEHYCSIMFVLTVINIALMRGPICKFCGILCKTEKKKKKKKDHAAE